MTDDLPAAPPSALCVWMWRFIFAGHVVAAGAWWWLMPGGFPWSNSHAWLNGVLPWLIAAGSFAGWWNLIKRKPSPTSTLVAATAMFWVALFATACLLYPISLRYFGPRTAAVVGAVVVSWWFLSPTGVRFPRTHAWIVVVAALLGVAYPLGIRAPSPSTKPLNPTPPDFTYIAGGDKELDAITRGLRVHVVPAPGEVVFTADHLTITTMPLLTFDSRSPDRGWTVFAPHDLRESPPRRFVGRRSEDDAALFRYLDDGTHVLRVRSRKESDFCEIESFDAYDRDVYSHLNSYCQLRIHGHGGLRLIFSPCPQTPIKVERADYPFGRPARFAYLRDDGMFVVCEATSGEKGPFKTLAEGPLARDGALSITLEDDFKSVAKITFHDWAAQASTALSPTAGWGVPQNAVEFRLLGPQMHDTVGIRLTLAGTSVGRGFDTVGHQAGTYRNRMRIEMVAPK